MGLIVADLVLFGVPGIVIIATQLVAMPLFAAGIINGIGHHKGYRNFECEDAARNISPWGIFLGGEELHNNHHAFPSSAKFSARRWEFDIGWMYITLFKFFGLAKVSRLAPEPARVEPRSHVDLETLRAVIVNRMHVLRDYSRKVTMPVAEAKLSLKRGVRKLLVRHPRLLDESAAAQLREIHEQHHELKVVHDFRERLALLWSGAHASNDKLLAHFKEWCAHAEASGIQALQDFAQQLRGYAMHPAAVRA
jgi:stearoyl-CoA desaturase (delta-9 desaturase)